MNKKYRWDVVDSGTVVSYYSESLYAWFVVATFNDEIDARDYTDWKNGD